jgi:hypothetical protein
MAYLRISPLFCLLFVVLCALPASASVFTEWTAEYNGPSSKEDRAVDIGVDIAGNVYVTGYSWSGDNIYTADYATIKYDTNGNQQWVALYDGPAHYEDSASAVAADASSVVNTPGTGATPQEVWSNNGNVPVGPVSSFNNGIWVFAPACNTVSLPIQP